MGLMNGILSFVFGDGRNVVAETAQVFREHAENGAVREATAKSESLAQFAAEFVHPRRGIFDRFVDGMNRLPRPLLALGTLWMFVTAMQAPEVFAQGMAGIALVPEPLWWLMGAIVSFYFGARHQAKGQDFQRSVAQSLAMMQLAAPAATQTEAPPQAAGANAALDAWQSGHD